MPQAEFFASFGLLMERDFLESALCEELRDEMATAAGHASLVGEEAADTVDQVYRKSHTAHVSDATQSLVTSRLEKLTPKVESHFETPLTGCQPPQFLRYAEGDYFRAHADHEAHGPDHVTERRISAVIFLNSEGEEPEPGTYGGGELTFFGLMDEPRGDALGFPLQGEQGLLVAFRSDLVHSVTPVTHGERFTVVSWFV
jgi:SM-20-related protein